MPSCSTTNIFFIYLQSKDPRFHALPLTSQRVAAFSDTVNELVYDVLISKVRQRLSEVARLPIWSSVEEQGGLPLPSFSAYPQAYVTSVGEYLLTLPQQLEPLAEGVSGNEAGNDEAQFFATEWIFKVIDVEFFYYTQNWILSLIKIYLPVKYISSLFFSLIFAHYIMYS